MIAKIQLPLFSGAMIILLAACGSDSVTSSSSQNDSSLASSSVVSTSASSTASVNDCQGAAAGEGYCLVWQDEFRGNAVDGQKWSYENNCYGGGNGEAQCYVTDSDNVWVDGEFLHIKAIREFVNGPALGDDDPGYNANDRSGSGDYSSGRIRSKGKGDWRYGRFEIRAKLPAGQGTWPAIWMLPTDWVYGGWAASGEIDIVESVNLKVDGENRVHGTLHYGDDWPNNVYSGEAYQLPDGGNPADAFHVYALEWEEGEMRWYVDGDHYATQTQDGWYTVAALNQPAAPYNQRFHMILNFAVGGDWAANTNATGIDPSVFPQEMLVDYVRVFECSKDPEKGRGCGSTDGRFVVNPGVTPPQPVVVDSSQDLVIFETAANDPYAWFTWTESGDVAYALTNAGGNYGIVAQLTFNTNVGIGFFQSPGPADLTQFNRIEFDLRIVADPRAVKDPIIFRADCTYPCSSGDRSLGYPGLNVWTHYSISLAELSSAGLNLSAVNTPFVIAPLSGNENGVVLQVDNIRIVR